MNAHSAVLDPEEKKIERLIFPTKYVVPKSLKFGHWLSENEFDKSKFLAAHVKHKDINKNMLQ